MLWVGLKTAVTALLCNIELHLFSAYNSQYLDFFVFVCFNGI